MTLVLNGKGLLLEGSNPKIEDKQVPDRLSSQTTTPGASNMAMILARLDDVYASQKSLCDQLKRHWDLLREAVLHLKFGGVLQYILIILFMEEILHHLGSLQIIGKTTNLNWWTPDFWTINSITVIKVNSNVFFIAIPTDFVLWLFGIGRWTGIDARFVWQMSCLFWIL